MLATIFCSNNYPSFEMVYDPSCKIYHDLYAKLFGLVENLVFELHLIRAITKITVNLNLKLTI